MIVTTDNLIMIIQKFCLCNLFVKYLLQGTASEATLVAVLSARARAVRLYKEKVEEEEDGVIMSKLICYGSKQSHSSVERAGLLAGVRMRLLEPDQELR